MLNLIVAGGYLFNVFWSIKNGIKNGVSSSRLQEEVLRYDTINQQNLVGVVA